MTSSWFFLSTLNYDARSTTHQISKTVVYVVEKRDYRKKIKNVTARRHSATSVTNTSFFSEGYTLLRGYAVVQLVEALRYKPERRWLDSRWCHWHNHSCRTMVPGLTQPLTDMSTGNISWGASAAGALGWQPCHHRVPTVLKCGSLELLQASGPVRASNWIAL